MLKHPEEFLSTSSAMEQCFYFLFQNESAGNIEDSVWNQL